MIPKVNNSNMIVCRINFHVINTRKDLIIHSRNNYVQLSRVIDAFNLKFKRLRNLPFRCLLNY